MLRILDKCISKGTLLFSDFDLLEDLPELLQLRKEKAEELEALAQAARVAQTNRQHWELRAMRLDDHFVKDVAGVVESYVVDELVGGGGFPPPLYGQYKRGTKRKAEPDPPSTLPPEV